MKTIDVYQSELKKTIPLEYLGLVRYEGEDEFLSFTNNKEYYIVRDNSGNVKVVDDDEEDYMYSIAEPTENGVFIILDDPTGIIERYKNRVY